MVNLVMAFFGSLCPAILINVRLGRAFWAGLSGAVGWLVYQALWVPEGNQVILATFAGALAVGVYSEAMARILKCPATIFSISGIFPLVPGIGAYMTIRYIVDSRMNQALVQAVETLASAGSIALGIMLASALFRIAKNLGRRIR